MAKEYNVDKINEELKQAQSSKYYGQWETDRIIESYFPDKRKGVCIEVGAADGIRGSNTKYFEDIGWDVLCIEPNILFKDSLEKYRKNVEFFAVGNKDTVDTLKIFTVGDNNIMSSLTSLSPDVRLVEDHKHLIKESFVVEVAVKPLKNIVKNNYSFSNIIDFDFISIDTEGTELDVLEGWDFKKFNVTLFVVENNYNDDNISNFMKNKGYKKDRRYKINDFFIKT